MRFGPPLLAVSRTALVCHECVTDHLGRSADLVTSLVVTGQTAVVSVSRSVGGILFPGPLRGSRSVTIHLCGLPVGASGPPGGVTSADEPPVPTARPCSGWGLPSRRDRSRRWCALTAPFHPCLCPHSRRSPGHRRSALCCPDPSDRSDLALASTLPCGVPTFLDPTPRGRAAVTRPTHRPVESRAETGSAQHRCGTVVVVRSGPALPLRSRWTGDVGSQGRRGEGRPAGADHRGHDRLEAPCRGVSRRPGGPGSPCRLVADRGGAARSCGPRPVVRRSGRRGCGTAGRAPRER